MIDTINGLVDVFTKVIEAIKSVKKLEIIIIKEKEKLLSGSIQINEKDLNTLEHGTADSYMTGKKQKMRTFKRFDGSYYIYPIN